MRPAIDACHLWLPVENEYRQHAREVIVRHVTRDGTLEGCAGHSKCTNKDL